MIQLLEMYGLIYFVSDDRIKVREVSPLTQVTADRIKREISNHRDYYLQHAPELIEKNEETGELLTLDPDTDEIRIFFSPPLPGPEVDPDRWNSVLE